MIHTSSLSIYIKSKPLSRKDNKLAIKYLEEALKCTPGNETILYFKALWKYQQALMEEDLDQKCKLLGESIRVLEDLLQNRVKWKGLEEDLQRAKYKYYRSFLKTIAN